MIGFIFFLLFSQTSLAADENRGWLGVFSRKESASKSHVTHQEVQLRYNFEAGENQQLLVRLGILRPISQTQEAGFLMAYVETGALKEYRPTLQYSVRMARETSTWALRSRLEWRDWEDTPTNSLRSRFQFSFLKPLSAKAALLVWDEPFLNLTQDSMSGERVFERNRAFLGARLTAFEHSFELGYLNQFVPRRKDTTEHVAVMYIYF